MPLSKVRISSVRSRELRKWIVFFRHLSHDNRIFSSPQMRFFEGSVWRFTIFPAIIGERAPRQQTLCQATRTLLQNTMAPRGTCRQLSGSLGSFIRAAQAKYRLAQRARFTSPNFCFHEIFMKFSSPNFFASEIMMKIIIGRKNGFRNYREILIGRKRGSDIIMKLSSVEHGVPKSS